MAKWEKSLKMLTQAIAPPAEPRYLDGPVLDATLPPLPDDHAALLAAYGSGTFEYSGIGCVIEVLNLRDPWHVNRWSPASYEILREYRKSEGEEYMPYPIYPETPGVMICGWNDRRDYYFWHAKATDPNQWPTIFYGDMEDGFEFEMPLVVFMQKLFWGEISRSELNFNEPDFRPDGFEFEPSFRPAFEQNQD